ncbi:MAG: YwaF family protein [Clostridia bacterium]|nr:YwaF family protein [Clostridia bacterium]
MQFFLEAIKQYPEYLREFFGYGGYERAPEGFLSWQHLLFISYFLAAMVFFGIYFGLRNRHADDVAKNKVLVATAIVINAFELFRIVALCIRNNNPLDWLYNLPLFLCSIQFITIPLAAFSKGRVREASLDFVFIFGILAAVMGNIGAGQNYGTYPVLSLDNVFSAITHSISGFASLYIAVSGLASMKKKNMWISFTIITVVSAIAYAVNLILPYNYMFLMHDDGTPYSIFYNLVNGNRVLYPLTVLLLFFAYIFVFYLIYYLIGKRRSKKAGANPGEYKEKHKV